MIGVKSSRSENIDFDVLELASLCKTQDDDVVGTFLINNRETIASTFISNSKIDEVKRIAEKNGIDKLVFNVDLARRQKNNIMKMTDLDVQDRHEVILNIFYEHAKTRIAKIEIELARLKFEYSKLIGAYENLSRTGGGIGTRGPGEQEIEYRRRELRQRIKTLNGKLDEIKKNKKVQSKKRQKEFKCVLIGYTNSGKTSILRRLTDYHAKIQDKLFATLDPVTKIMKFKNNDICLITDTIGFIRDIPPELINSFYETLSEIKDADLKLHIVDISSPYYKEQIDTVNEVAQKLDFGQESILVFNKIDLIYDENILKRILEKYPGAIFVSARKNKNIDMIIDKIYSKYNEIFEEKRIPLNRCGKCIIKLQNKIHLNVVYESEACIVKYRKIYHDVVKETLNDID
ncbi:MAG: GTPase HflX [Proteobacteria bacterium]|nr:GTPase HflX [Pseudomonadota bacterium]